jgi:hypothetical protein
MYSNYKRPRFTEESDDEDVKDNAQGEPTSQIVSTTQIVSTNSSKKLNRGWPIVPSRKRPRFTEESDDEEPPSQKERIEPLDSPLQSLKRAPPKSILKKPQTPFIRPLKRDPPIDPEFRKVFISNIDAARPVEEVTNTILELMKKHQIPCEQKVHILPPNIGGRHHRGVAWITLEHQDDIDKAINRLCSTTLGSRVMKAKVHRNPMLLGINPQANPSCSVSTFSVRRGGYAPTLLRPTAMIPEWQPKPTIPQPASWVTNDHGEGKKIFIWNIDNNKTQMETETFIFQTLAAKFGSDVVERVSTYCKGMKVYAFVKFTRSNYVFRALEVINGLQFGSKYLGAQVSRQRKSKDLDFNPW